MMSNKLLTIVTMTAVTLHAALGCCWHHAHHEESKTDQAVVATNCKCHSHAAASDEETKSTDNESGHESCDEPECIFFLSDNTDREASVALTYWLPVASDASSGIITAIRHSRPAELHCDHIHACEPLHALHQVWLI